MPMMTQFKSTALVACVALSAVIGASSGQLAYADDDAKQLGERIQRLVGVSFAMIDKGDYDKIPALFHYPEGYSEGEIKRDQCLISKSLKYLTGVFGKPENTRPQEHAGQIQHYSIYIRAAGNEYWKQRETHASTSFFTDFPKVGAGTVNFQFEDLEAGRPKLRSLAYGFEASEKSKRRLTTLGKEFARYVSKIKLECDAFVN